ncbi:DUF1922 domain-containing protein [Candidatus Bathyarchaeota archaeon]|nr:DUF1922 domain-containing protein [Candidatus Bathyarchaeota archaeon]
MKSAVIVACTRCRCLLIAIQDQKTRSCSYCGARITISKAEKVAIAKNSFEASKILRKLKMRKDSNSQ